MAGRSHRRKQAGSGGSQSLPASLAAHPRLAVSGQRLQALAQAPALPLLALARRQVLKDAEACTASAVFDWPTDTHNAHLIRARINQGRVVTLLAAYFITGQARFKQAAMDHVAQMAQWEYWSWIAWRKNDPRVDAVYDLSYGENSMTLALAYDWLHGELTGPQRKLIVDQARRRAFKSFLRNAPRAGWFGRPDSNWNSVCTGGAGMLALALYEDLPQAPQVLAMAEESIRPFMEHLSATGGGWPEGIGYWNYGMRYAFWYLLSHERATGRRHGLLARAATRRSLSFPLDFTPNGVPCGFSDGNGWQPLAFHWAMAERLGCPDVLAELDRRLASPASPSALRKNWVTKRTHWPQQAELLLMHPGRTTRPPKPAATLRSTSRSVAKLYPGIDWAVLADQMPNPALYLALRGGSTAVPHGHRDILSFHCVMGREAMISSLNTAQYLDTTFGPRREELYDISPASKNTLLVNGVGVVAGSAVTTTRLKLRGAVRGFRLDATEALGTMRDGLATKFCGRAVLMLQDKAFLILDRVELTHFGRVESRMHSFARVRFARQGAELIGRGCRMQVTYACNVPAGLYPAMALHTTPQPNPATVLRWCTQGLHHEVVMATLLYPGPAAPKLQMTQTARGVDVRVAARGWSSRVRLTRTLRPV